MINIQHKHQRQKGIVHRLTHQSSVLKGNPLQDPCERTICVYTPHGWTMEKQMPLLVDLAGYGNSGIGHTNWKAFGENLPERLDRLIGDDIMLPVVVVFPDCHTRLGGNQYINSVGIGRYSDYLIQEVIPEIERSFNCGGSGQRGIFGKSSGGFGALWHGMYHADFWSAIVSCAGDSAFEVTALPSIYNAARTLAAHNMSIARFITHHETTSKPSREDVNCLMICALSATYDYDPESEFGIRFPIDLHTGTLITERWNNWLRHDPAIIITKRQDALHHLKGIWLECGKYDEFNIQFGTRRISSILTNAGIIHEYKEFDGGHLNTDYRLDCFLPWLAQTVTI